MTLLWAGHPSCPSCLRATKILRAIHAKVAVAMGEVMDICGPVRKENRKRWEDFSKRCRGWLFGKRYFRKNLAPKLLPDPAYQEAEWFVTAAFKTQLLMEEMHEILLNDEFQHECTRPAYYRNPVRAGELTKTTLMMLGQLGYPPAPPPEFDLWTRAQEAEVYVMCAATYKILPVTDCKRIIEPKSSVGLYVSNELIRVKQFDLVRAVLDEVSC